MAGSDAEDQAAEGVIGHGCHRPERVRVQEGGAPLEAVSV